MIEVSREFKKAVYAPIRKVAAKIIFAILDNSAYEDATPLATSSAPLSRLHQITDRKRILTHKYATFERDRFKLDGSFRIPPKPTETNDSLGWWSDEISGLNGVFETPQAVTIEFSEPHNSIGLTIVFDPLEREYAIDFDIDVYQDADVLIASKQVRDNEITNYVWINGLDDYKKVVVTIYKWVKQNRRAKIAEIDFGAFLEYEGDKLIKVNLIEQLNVVGDTLPANEVKFIIDNSNKEFNILNPTGFYRFLKERQEVTLSIGVEVEENIFEYVNMAGYYLVDWQSDEGALTTTLTARNIFDLLDKEYTQGTISTLYQLAEDVLTKANIQNYFIHPSLQEIPTNGFIDKVTYRKALQCIGIASKSAVYQNRNAEFIIEPFVILDENTSYINFVGSDMYTGIITPIVYNGYDMKNITFDNVYKEPQINLEKLIQTLIMVVYENGVKREYAFQNEGIKEGATLKCDNPLIHTLSQAQDIAAWILAESNLRALYQVNWRQNPALECGDIVFIEDSFGMTKQSRITKQEYEFSGFLSGKTETKGGV